MTLEDEIVYSPTIKGDPGNWNWPCNFDYQDGYLGINQTKGGDIERVLMTPKQVKELLKFLKKQGLM